MNLKALIEQKNGKIDKLDELLKKAETETRALSEEEQAEFTKLEDEIRALDTTVQAAERRARMERVASGQTTDDEEQRAIEAGQEFLAILRSETRALDSTAGSGGKLIPTIIANRIIETVKNICPIYSRATVYNVGGDLAFPVYDESEGGVQAAYVDEMQELTEHSGKFTTVVLKDFIVGALTKISVSLMNRNDFDLVSYAVQKVAEAFAEFIEKECLKGTPSKMQGVCASTNIVTAASATAITADELIDLQDKINDKFQSGACWIMNQKTRSAIRKLKDNDGRYLLNKDLTGEFGYTLLGKPVFVSDQMAAVTNSAVSVVYGDLSGLYIKFAQNLQIQVLMEKYATQHAVGIIGYAEMDSKIVEPQKLAILKQHA